MWWANCGGDLKSKVSKILGGYVRESLYRDSSECERQCWRSRLEN